MGVTKGENAACRNKKSFSENQAKFSTHSCMRFYQMHLC